MRLDELAATLGAKLEGDGGIEINGAASLEGAGPGDISFIKELKQAKDLSSIAAGALVVPVNVKVDRPAIKAENPLHTFSLVLEILYPQADQKPGTHSSASLGENVKLGNGSSVGIFASVGPDTVIGARSVIHPGARIGAGCVIGADCHIHENVVIKDRVRMGDRCIIHPLSVLGSDGFGYVQLKDGSSKKITHIGDVKLEDDVEIGACTSVDRAMLGTTIIKKGVKIDNQVQVAHNVVIGENTLIAGCAGVAGSVVIGKNVMIGGAAAVSDHVTVADKVMIAGMTGVHSSLKEPGVYAGPMAMKHMEYKRFLLSGRRIDKLDARLKKLESDNKKRGE